MAREALIAVLVCIMIIFMNTMLINEYSQISKESIESKLEMLYNLLSQASSLIIYLHVLG